MTAHRKLTPLRTVLGVAAALLCASSALAQTTGSIPSNFTHGYGLSSGELENPIDVSTRDANGNTTIVNGVMQTSGGVFSNLYSVGASGGSTVTGNSSGAAAGYGSATAIGNNLNVVVDGQYNTVIVNATQTNTGAVTASTILNGKVNLDDGQ